MGLTFNTTSPSLARALADGLLSCRTPLRPVGSEQKRHILVTPEIDALMDQRTLFGIFPYYNTDILVGRFSAGHTLTVTQKKTRKKPELEQLEGFDEIWALCPRKPAPGWRLLGRFYEKNVLILLRPWDKHLLFPKYAEAAAQIIEDWQTIFGQEEPHRGECLDDYLTGGVSVDEN